LEACLSAQELQSLQSGTLSAAEMNRAQSHLKHCRSCSSRLDETMAAPAPALAPTLDIDVTQSVSHQGLSHAPVKEESASFPHIEGYDIKSVLGQGGMGVVYRAVQRNLGRIVALKVLPIVTGSTSPNAVARFRREATAAARLHHTNIIPVYDFGEAGHALYYAMELIEGEPLDDLIPRQAESHVTHPSTLMAGFWRRSTRTSDSTVADEHIAESIGTPDTPPRTMGSARDLRKYFEQVSRWMTDTADALDYAHKEGVIHRDIKPANLILSKEQRIMIADFGLAKTTDDNTVTRAGSFLGTLRYASPEQAKGYDVDHRTDIYSLGVTMYELLCFKPAYPMLGQKEMLHAILEQDPEPPRRLVPTVPPELETICLKAMEKSVSSRYQTAREMADDLRRYLNDLPIVAKRPNLIQRSRKFVRRHKLLVTSITAIVLVVISTLFTMRAQADRRRAEADRRRAEVDRHYESGMYWAGEQNWEAADGDFQAALSIDPVHIPTMLALVWMNIERHKKQPQTATTQALEDLDQICRRVLALDPDQATALSYRSILLKNLERYDEAIAVTQRVIELHPDYYAAWSNLGAFLAITGNLESAVENLRRGVQLAEQMGGGRAADHASVWRNLAAAELHLKNPLALDNIQSALRANPHDVTSWLLLVRARLTLEGHIDPSAALDDAKHADRLTLATSARTKRLLAAAHLSNRHYQASAAQAHAALLLGDEPAFNLLMLAASEANLGKKDLARDYFEQALQTWPAELSTKPYIATYDEGVLWFESAEELNQLRSVAELALENG
jgi:serine/threonine protein kinase